MCRIPLFQLLLICLYVSYLTFCLFSALSAYNSYYHSEKDHWKVSAQQLCFCYGLIKIWKNALFKTALMFVGLKLIFNSHIFIKRKSTCVECAVQGRHAHIILVLYLQRLLHDRQWQNFFRNVFGVLLTIVCTSLRQH